MVGWTVALILAARAAAYAHLRLPWFLSFNSQAVNTRVVRNKDLNYIINLRMSADPDRNIGKHFVDSLGSVESDEGEVSWWGTHPHISYLRNILELYM